MDKRRSKSSHPTRKKSEGRKPNPGRKNTSSPANSLPSTVLSLENLGSLRTMCKNCIKYLQQADRLLDTLFIASNSLNETGLLKKIIQTKGKGLSTGDLTSLLFAFMNTPLAEQFFKGGSSSEAAPEQPAEQKPAPEAPKQELPPANKQPGIEAHNPQQPNVHSWPGYMPGYGMPPQNPGQYLPPGPGWYPPGPGQYPNQG
ncbi:hypothetical protein [Effusibacillus consociatus]|uniref:Uncharacterized protein n=1 Tax=Effusibacillus consociatus TaxID=1117041 RepID=A0ABV9Q8K0_9BACL